MCYLGKKKFTSLILPFRGWHLICKNHILFLRIIFNSWEWYSILENNISFLRIICDAMWEIDPTGAELFTKFFYAKCFYPAAEVRNESKWVLKMFLWCWRSILRTSADSFCVFVAMYTSIFAKQNLVKISAPLRWISHVVSHILLCIL